MPSRTVNIVVRATGATSAARDLRGVAQSLSLVDRKGRGASRSITSMGSAASRASSMVWNLSQRAAAGMLAVGTAATITGLKFNATMERQTVAFTGFLGSAKAARDYVSSLYSIAAKTPFEFEDVLKGTRTLVAYGMAADDARQTFVGMGDAIAATGGGTDEIRRATIALGQIQAAGVLHAQDLNQLIQAGVVSLPMLTRRMGTNTKRFRKDMKENKIVAADFFSALTESWGNDPMYKGAAAKQARTFYGQLEKLRDFSKQTLGTITEPLFEALNRKVLPALTRTVTEFNRIWRRDKLTLAEKLDLSGASIQRNLDPVVAAIEAWWRRNHVGKVLLDGFERSLVYVGDKLPGLLRKTITTGFDAWLKMGPTSKVITAWGLLRMMGIRPKELAAAGGIIGSLLFGRKGGKGRGGMLGGATGVLNVEAGVVNVYGGVGGGRQGGKPGWLKRTLGKGKDLLLPAAGWAARHGRTGLGIGAVLAGGQWLNDKLGLGHGGLNTGGAPGLRDALRGRGPHGHHASRQTRVQAVADQMRAELSGGYWSGANRMSAVLGHMANGGVVGRSGPYEVGERGPEKVWLPKGAAVDSGAGDIVLHTHIHLDGKQVATAVQRAALRKKAVR